MRGVVVVSDIYDLELFQDVLEATSQLLSVLEHEANSDQIRQMHHVVVRGGRVSNPGLAASAVHGFDSWIVGEGATGGSQWAAPHLASRPPAAELVTLLDVGKGDHREQHVLGDSSAGHQFADVIVELVNDIRHAVVLAALRVGAEVVAVPGAEGALALEDADLVHHALLAAAHGEGAAVDLEGALEGLHDLAQDSSVRVFRCLTAAKGDQVVNVSQGVINSLDGRRVELGRRLGRRGVANLRGLLELGLNVGVGVVLDAASLLLVGPDFLGSLEREFDVLVVLVVRNFGGLLSGLQLFLVVLMEVLHALHPLLGGARHLFVRCDVQDHSLQGPSGQSVLLETLLAVHLVVVQLNVPVRL
mmetsp:Transcript_44003/g.94274  ORF Transcript_44003/g.94274 Transcript_44003/m.94274 type:complete len:360 (-) Transcript_44003:838-1917(-)